MISAAAELDHGETRLWRLTSQSQQQWPGFAAELERCSGRPVGLRRTGTLLVAPDTDEEARLERRLRLLAEVGVVPELLGRRELRHREPALAATARAAAWLPDDFCVLRSRVLDALGAAGVRAGVELVSARGTVAVRGGRAVGVTLDDDTRIAADHVVLSGGWRSKEALADALPEVASLRPVKGELVDLELARPAVAATVRAVVDRTPVYLVPHDDTHLTVGATSADVGADTTPTVGGALDLLAAATTLVPELRDAAITAHRVGLRPGTADNHPLLGASSLPGLTLATGHYRHGFLLTPLTAAVVTEHVAAALTEGDIR